MMPVFPSKPSISVRSWFSVCSRSSLPPPTPAPRDRPTASISSTKMMQGAFSSAALASSTTSSKSALASSTPATSSKVTPVFGSIWNLALDLPKAVGLPGPPIPPGPPGPPAPPFRREQEEPAHEEEGERQVPQEVQRDRAAVLRGGVRGEVDVLLPEAREELLGGARQLHAHALHAVAQLGAHGLHDGDGAPLVEVHLLHAPHVEVLEEAAVAHARRGHVRARRGRGVVRRA